MNKNPLLTILVLLFLVSCNKDTDINEGNKRLVKVEIYEPSIQRLITLDYKYDNAGRLVEISGIGSQGTGAQVFHYDASGKIKSYTVSNSTSGTQYTRELQVDAAGRVIRANVSSPLPNFLILSNTYTYDAKGRLVIDSTFAENGNWYSYVNFEYDNNDNIIAYQQFINLGTSILSQERTTIHYDSKMSPFHQIGQFLYTAGGGNGDMFFYISKNNPLKVTQNNTVITPGGGFNNQYYSNSLLKVKAAKVPDALRQTFYYAP